MRYEVMQFAQFVLSLSLVLGAFLAGVYAGWRRWGREPATGHDPWLGEPAVGESTPRRDLFAPELAVRDEPGELELDLRSEDGALRLCLPAPSPQSSPLL